MWMQYGGGSKQIPIETIIGILFVCFKYLRTIHLKHLKLLILLILKNISK